MKNFQEKKQKKTFITIIFILSFINFTKQSVAAEFDDLRALCGLNSPSRKIYKKTRKPTLCPLFLGDFSQSKNKYIWKIEGSSYQFWAVRTEHSFLIVKNNENIGLMKFSRNFLFNRKLLTYSLYNSDDALVYQIKIKFYPDIPAKITILAKDKETPLYINLNPIFNKSKKLFSLNFFERVSNSWEGNVRFISHGNVSQVNPYEKKLTVLSFGVQGDHFSLDYKKGKIEETLVFAIGCAIHHGVFLMNR